MSWPYFAIVATLFVLAIYLLATAPSGVAIDSSGVGGLAMAGE